MQQRNPNWRQMPASDDQLVMLRELIETDEGEVDEFWLLRLTKGEASDEISRRLRGPSRRNLG